MSTIQAAIDLAEQVHEDQCYSDLPYMYHIYGVLARVREKYGTEDAKYTTGRQHFKELQMVAVLHDYLEDGGSLQRLRSHGFSAEVVGACVVLKHIKVFTYAEYIDTIGRARGVAGFLARAVKYEDMSFNLANTPSTYKLQKYTYYREVLNSWNKKAIEEGRGGYRP